MKIMDFTVRCTDAQCKQQPATYKIAAEWSGGGITELKTFGFANDECLERVFRDALRRVSKVQPAEGESLGEMRIYRLDPRQHDYDLKRAIDLEEMLKSATRAG